MEPRGIEPLTSSLPVWYARCPAMYQYVRKPAVERVFGLRSVFLFPRISVDNPGLVIMDVITPSLKFL
ncbi:hypothetical protein SK3146_02184 [Paenibacillus konkukensis]|uniref:Uncharacterized protein n=1 Tax=Paenibacillus konkukensis TaxID=2020716 RepID=A0ABY4RNK9_9BACL|nr:hypothetical protein SK3146_02184 [Paenibacillus konkukensis]